MNLSPYYSEFKSTLKLAAPIIMVQVGHVLMGVIDSIMVGRIGATPLAASAFVNFVIAVPLTFALGLSSAISVRVAQNFGAGNKGAIRENLFHGFVMMGAMTLLTVVILFAQAPYLDFFNQPAEVLTEAHSYYSLIVWSLVPSLLLMPLRQFSDGLQFTGPPMVMAWIALAANVVLNWIFIYGNLGAPALGLDGAGYATVGARLINFTLLFFFVLKSPRYTEYVRTGTRLVFQWNKLKTLLHIGFPSGVQYIFEVGAFACAGLMAGWLSTADLAAHQIALNIASMTFMIALGLSFAASVRVGEAFGKNNIAKLKNIGFSAILFTATIMALNGIALVLARNLLPTFYVDETAVIILAAQMLIVAAIFQFFDGAQAVAMGVLRGCTDVKIPTVITFISYWIIAIPTSYFLAFQLDLGLLGIWIGLAVGLFVSATSLMARFALFTRSKT